MPTASSRVSAAPPPATAILKAARAPADAHTWSAPPWLPPRRWPDALLTCVSGTTRIDGDGKIYYSHRDRRFATARQRRYRPDHPQAVSEAGGAHRIWRRALLRLAL